LRITALKELVEEKTKGHTVVVKKVERPAGGIIDLMAALERSIEGTALTKGKNTRCGKKRSLSVSV
jgi:non-homologous end joining protein Ku